MSRSLFRHLLPLIAGTVVSIVLLYFVLKGDEVDKKFDELALGGENTAVVGQVNKLKVHCHDFNDADECFRGYADSGKGNDVVLWLGNSQLHVINQMLAGEELSSVLLHKKLYLDNKYLLTFSQPNANLQEHYLLFESLSNSLPVSTLILPVVFDDLRDTGVRDGLRDAFDNEVKNSLQSTKIGLQLIVAQADTDAAGNDMAALDDTVQEQSEKYLNSLLADYWEVWDQRPTLRGDIFGNLYFFRNWLFGITPSSIRRVIPGRYALNMQAMKATLDSAQEQGVQVLLYIVPLRNDVAIPYDLRQYEKFKSEVEAAAHGDHVKFIDAGDLVPAEFWGTKNSTTIGSEQELDFMHFQASGHILLTDKIFNELKILWELN
ncbi:MAG: hypothetical protein HOG49_03330 [Candidatus Scalindua sp.]|nr:hypothetical protein [Candidatus Scalindua sp.]